MAFSFGAAAQPAASSGFSFGAPTPAPSSAFSFGASTPAPAPTTTGTTTTFGGFGAPQQQQAPSPSPLFGGFGGTTTTNTNTSMFGAPAAATSTAAPAFGSGLSFGQTQQPQQQQQPSAFGGFGGFGGFGAAAPAAAAPAATSSGFGGFFNAQPQQQLQQQQLVPAGPAISIDTRFTDLPEGYKAILEKTSADYKAPMRAGLDEVARFNPQAIDELSLELSRTNLVAMQLKSRQEQLLAEIGTFQSEAKRNAQNARDFGARGLVQIERRGGVAGSGAYLRTEELPTGFYLEVAERLEGRLRACVADIDHLAAQLGTAMVVVADYDAPSSSSSSSSSSSGGYGGVYGSQRVGPQQLVRLIQRQGDAFLRVAAAVSEVHAEADAMRAHYRQRYRADPFAEEDRRVEAKERLLALRLRDDEIRHSAERASAAGDAPVQGQGQGQGQQPAAINAFGATTTAATTSAFGTGAASPWGAFASTGNKAATPTTTGFGGFAAPAAAGTSATPGFGSPGPFSGGFGATPATAAAPAASAFGGFGALSSPLATKSPAGDLATPAGGIFGAAGGGFGAAFGSGAVTTDRGKGKNKKK